MINGEDVMATHCCEVRASVAIWYTKAFSLFHALSSTKVSFVFYGTRKSKRKKESKVYPEEFWIVYYYPLKGVFQLSAIYISGHRM